MNWYLKKEFYGVEDDIEGVIIHYTYGPVGQAPEWTRTESRSMQAGEKLKAGVGQVARYGPAAPEVPQHVDPKLYKKVLKLPNDIRDEATGTWTGNFLVHYFYEIVRDGDRQFSPVFTDEIATRDIYLNDPTGILFAVCANWSVYDWDSPQFSPAEDPRFIAIYGDEHPLRQLRFYSTEDQESFAIAKKAVVDHLPLPHRFYARASAPVGAPVRLRFHVGNWGLPEAQRWEDYWLDETFVMTRDAEPLVFSPLGTDVLPEPATRVTPDLLMGNAYLPVLNGYTQYRALVTAEELCTTEETATVPAAERVLVTAG